MKRLWRQVAIDPDWACTSCEMEIPQFHVLFYAWICVYQVVSQNSRIDLKSSINRPKSRGTVKSVLQTMSVIFAIPLFINVDWKANKRVLWSPSKLFMRKSWRLTRSSRETQDSQRMENTKARRSPVVQIEVACPLLCVYILYCQLAMAVHRTKKLLVSMKLWNEFYDPIYLVPISRPIWVR